MEEHDKISQELDKLIDQTEELIGEAGVEAESTAKEDAEW